MLPLPIRPEGRHELGLYVGPHSGWHWPPRHRQRRPDWPGFHPRLPQTRGHRLPNTTRGTSSSTLMAKLPARKATCQRVAITVGGGQHAREVNAPPAICSLSSPSATRMVQRATQGKKLLCRLPYGRGKDRHTLPALAVNTYPPRCSSAPPPLVPVYAVELLTSLPRPKLPAPSAPKLTRL